MSATPTTTTLTTTIITTTTNTPTQALPNASKGKMAAVAAAGRKRKLTLMNGEELDLQQVNAIAPVRPEVVEAMKLRIIELEDQLAAKPPAKRARTIAAADVTMELEAGPSTTPASLTKADEKKRKIHLKKIFDRLKKECKAVSCKFQGAPKTIKIEEVFEVDEFNAIFAGKGRLIQPTPENKPKSTVTIMDFNTAQVQVLFGDELKALKGNRWSRGGVPVRTFGAGFGGLGSSFSKSVKQGPCDVEILRLDVNYSKNGMKCTLKFDVGDVGGGSGYDSDEWY
ncbi:hypothetical protein BKA93DRAFT_889205 [Sparassis latifolia]